MIKAALSFAFDCDVEAGILPESAYYEIIAWKNTTYL